MRRTSNNNRNSNDNANEDNYVFAPMHIAGLAKHNNKMTFWMLRKHAKAASNTVGTLQPTTDKY